MYRLNRVAESRNKNYPQTHNEGDNRHSTYPSSQIVSAELVLDLDLAVALVKPCLDIRLFGGKHQADQAFGSDLENFYEKVLRPIERGSVTRLLNAARFHHTVVLAGFNDCRTTGQWQCASQAGVNGFNGNGTIGKLLMDIPSARKIHAVELAELSASYLLDIATHRPPPIRSKFSHLSAPTGWLPFYATVALRTDCFENLSLAAPVSSQSHPS
ncbi:hypothetical protein PGT21_025158 [Puccinia graminis f. sp. tritici]|uniref:Uncharacterized protein n=1 Tax=Puccinia graminis f. sp. tritici TaxID=56615 RepID=A0A5B0NNG5_PUCGR|nr:hypothetical protein PGT21_025158 [Puccinia graminis f. sp. tritici]